MLGVLTWLEMAPRCTCVAESLTTTVPRHLERELWGEEDGADVWSLTRIWPLGMQGFHACSGPSFHLQQDFENNRGRFLSLWPIYEPASTDVPIFLGEAAANFFFTC